MKRPAPTPPTKPVRLAHGLPSIPDLVVPATAPRAPVVLSAREPDAPAPLRFDAALEPGPSVPWRWRALFAEDDEDLDLSPAALPARVPPPSPPQIVVDREVAPLIVELHRRRLYDLAAAIAGRYEITVEEMMGPRRTRTPARARVQLMYVLRHYHRRSFCEIGEVLGKDHQTVMHNLNALPADAWAEVESVVRPFLREEEDAPASALRPAMAAVQ